MYIDVNMRRVTTEWQNHKRILGQFPFLANRVPFSNYERLDLNPDSPDLLNPISKFGSGMVYLGNKKVHSLYDTMELVKKYSPDSLEEDYSILQKSVFPDLKTKKTYSKCLEELEASPRSKDKKQERMIIAVPPKNNITTM